MFNRKEKKNSTYNDLISLGNIAKVGPPSINH